jgi:bacterioferritin
MRNFSEKKKMERTKLVENLNKALSLELAAVIQYMQHSYLIAGPEREVFRDFFRSNAEEARKHAEQLGDKIVALGGIPTVEPATIRQSDELKEMLRQNLELEREALAAYMAAWASCDESDLPQKFWLEGRIAEEQIHVEELEKLTSEKIGAPERKRIVLKQMD